MNLLDTKTILFSDLLTTAICIAVTWLMWVRYRRRSPAFAYWLAAYGLHFAGVLMVILRLAIPPSISILFGTPLFLAGTLLLLLGSERYVGRGRSALRLWLNCAVLALVFLMQAGFTFAWPSLHARNTNLSAGLVIYMGQTAWLFLRRSPPEYRASERLPGRLSLAFVAASVLRVFVECVVPPGQDFFKSGLYDNLVLITYSTLFVALAFSLLLMVNHRFAVEMEQDIERRKQAEEELRKSEQLFRDIALCSADWVWQVDAQGRYTSCSERVRHVLGYEPGELVGRTPFDLMPADEAARVGAVFAETAAARAAIVDLENWNVTKDGRKVLLLTNGVPVFDESGNLLGYRGVDKDITERKQAEQALAESEQRFRSLSDAAMEGVMVHARGTIQDANLAFARLFGYERPEELVGRNGLEILLTPESRERIRLRMQQQQVGLIELTGVRKDGSTFALEADSRPVKHLGHDARIVSCRDVTEQKRAEQALRESEQQFRSITATAPDTLIVARQHDGLILYANEQAGRLLGVPATVLISRRTLDFYARPEDRQTFLAMLKRGFVREWEVLLKRADGSLFLAQVNGQLGTFENEAAIYVGLRDITERKRAEEALYAAGRARELERNRLRRVLDGMPDLVYITNRDFDIEYVNPAMERAFGAPGGRKCHDYFSHRASVCPDCPNARVFAGETHRREVRTKQGVIYDVYSTPLANPEGGVSRLAALRDITELRLAEERDLEHLRQVQSLRDTAMGFVQTGPGEDIYRYVAERLREICGECCVVVNSFDAGANRFTVRAIAGLSAGLQKVIELMGREPVGTEFELDAGQLATCSGAKLQRFAGIHGLSYGMLPKALAATLEQAFGLGDVHAAAILWRGELLGTANILMRRGHGLMMPPVAEAFVNQAAVALRRWLDEVELERYRQHLQELVAERTRELGAAQEKLVLHEKLATLGRVAGSVAHELRNPLGTIRNASFYLQQTVADKLEGKPLRHLRTIEESVESANRAITTILDFTWQQRTRRERSALKPILGRAVAEAAVPPSVSVLIALPPDLPPVVVDVHQMAAVFRNLVTNSVQAMPAGGRITIAARTEGTDVVVAVSDTGAGIPPDHMGRLFEPLFTTREVGVGLGLAICKAFVEAHGGMISAASEVGKGTTFTVTLPAAGEQVASHELRATDNSGDAIRDS